MSGPTEDPPGVAEWISVALVCGSAVLSALLDLLFLTEFYVGKNIVPLVVLAAVAGNVVLPFWGYHVVHTLRGAVLPVVCWLVAVLALSLYTRPEGDLFVVNAYQQQGAFYALLLIGAAAGFTTIVVVGGRAAARPTPPPPDVPRPSPSGRPTKGPRVNR